MACYCVVLVLKLSLWITTIPALKLHPRIVDREYSKLVSGVLASFPEGKRPFVIDVDDPMCPEKALRALLGKLGSYWGKGPNPTVQKKNMISFAPEIQAECKLQNSKPTHHSPDLLTFRKLRVLHV